MAFSLGLAFLYWPGERKFFSWRQIHLPTMSSNAILPFHEFILHSVKYVIVIAWCRVQYGIYFSSYFCFQILHEREARVQYENKNNEKNISHIARRFHAIISLSYGIFIMFWLFCIDVGRKNRVFDVRYISF